MVHHYDAASHPSLDDPNVYIYYRYEPSKGAAILFIILFFLSTFLHIYQLFRSKSYFMIALVVGGLFEAVGYIGRAMSSTNQWDLGPYVLQATLLLVAPALFAASIYMTLGRIILLVSGESHSLIRQRWLTKIFVGGDIISFLIQGGGAGIMSGQTMSSYKLGQKIVVTGLFTQVASFGVFIVVAIIFHRRLLRAPTAASAEEGIKWQKYMYTLYAGSLLILIRSVFRIVEYLGGNDGPLLRSEVFFYVFDAVLMFKTILLFNFFHPGAIAGMLKSKVMCQSANAIDQEAGLKTPGLLRPSG